MGIVRFFDVQCPKVIYGSSQNKVTDEGGLNPMKVDILTREYPPYVYGGAGVHAEELSKVLAERIDVTVRAFDGQRTEAGMYPPSPEWLGEGQPEGRRLWNAF